MSYHLAFTVDELPKLPNRLLTASWYIVKRHTDRWHTWVLSKVAGRKPAAPLQRARLELTRHSSRECDPDALAVSFKPVIDGLVVQGVLAGDTSAHVDLRVTWNYSPPRKGFITVEVTEVL